MEVSVEREEEEFTESINQLSTDSKLTSNFPNSNDTIKAINTNF
jgi:hypothetical protein